MPTSTPSPLGTSPAGTSTAGTSTDGASRERASNRVETEGRRNAWAARRSGDASHVGGLTRFLAAIAGAAIVLAIWWVLSESGRWSPIILPTPAKVWEAFIESVTVHDGRRGLSGHFLWEHLWASLWRILRGVFWAFLIGVPIGLALGLWRPFELIAEPLVGFLRSLPPLGYFSLLIIWFGIDDASKVWLLLLAAFPPIALSVASGVANVRSERVNAALVLGASQRQLMRYTVLPSILPDLLTGVRIAVGFAWTTIVAAETSNGIPGIGGLAWATKKELRSDIAIMCVIVVGLTAVALDSALRLLERRIAWKGRA